MVNARDRFRATVVAVVLAPFLVGAAIYLLGLFSPLETEALSLRFDLRGERPAPRSVALVVVDQAAIRDLSPEWGQPPYPRRIWARLLGEMGRAKAGPAAFDLAFEAPTAREQDRGPADDLRFEAALRRYGKVASAFTAVELPGRVPNIFPWLAPGKERFAELALTPGYVGYGGDGSSAGLVPGMVASFAGYPTLGVAAAGLAGPVSVPGPNGEGELLLNYYGPPGTIPRVDIRDLLDPGVARAALYRQLRGRVVVIGIDDPTGDDRPRPTTAPGGGAMSGAEINATAAANALDGSFLRELPVPASLLLIFVMGTALPASALLVRRRWVAPAVAAALVVAYAAGSQLAFAGNVLVPVVAPLAAFAASAGAWLYLRHRQTERDLGELRRRFADFEPDLVGGVLAGTLDGGGLDAEMIVPGYRLQAVIGRGAMGVVYRAEELSSGRPAAVKIIRPDLSDDQRFRERFERESRLAAALEHPNVIPVYSSGQEDGMLFLAGRLVEGPNLSQRLREGPPVPDDELAGIVDGVASALDRAHQIGLVHRDVKPANILLDERASGHPYLTDFGIATMAGEKTLTEAGGMLGTVGFAAPEQLAGGQAGPPADIYGLGAVTFAALTGGQAPPAPLAVGDDQEWPGVIAARPRVVAVLRTALARDPQDRYKSATKFADDLRDAFRSEPK